jgi:hypothetical protein
MNLAQIARMLSGFLWSGYVIFTQIALRRNSLLCFWGGYIADFTLWCSVVTFLRLAWLPTIAADVRPRRRMYDSSNKGAVNFEEFVELHKFILQTQENFNLLDVDRDNKLSRNEVFSALEQAGAHHRHFRSCLFCAGLVLSP